MSINKTFISGNLTQEPHCMAKPSGESVLEFGLAYRDSYTPSGSDEPKPSTGYIQCYLFGPVGDKKRCFLKKGTKVSAEGHLHYRTWTTKDGHTGHRLELIIDKLDIMSLYTKPVENSHDGHGQQTNEQSPVATPTEFTVDDLARK